jgi:hypothetical protein
MNVPGNRENIPVIGLRYPLEMTQDENARRRRF